MKTIFVSSTFKDMHFERDAIQEIALSALEQLDSVRSTMEQEDWSAFEGKIQELLNEKKNED